MAITSGVGRRMLVISAVPVMGAAGSAGASGIAQIIHARQNHFRTLGRTAKSIRDQAGRSHPNWAVVEADADRVERLASALPSWFPQAAARAMESGRGRGRRSGRSRGSSHDSRAGFCIERSSCARPPPATMSVRSGCVPEASAGAATAVTVDFGRTAVGGTCGE